MLACLLLALACSDPAPPGKAEVQAARSAAGATSTWEGPWTLRLLATDPAALAPLGEHLPVALEPWTGAWPAAAEGEAVVLWAAGGAPSLDTLPTAGRGERVVVVPPGAGDAALALPWSGIGVLDPLAEATRHGAFAPEATTWVAGRVLAEHYGIGWVPVDAPLDPGLRAWLGGAEPGAADPRLRPADPDDPQVAVRLLAARAGAPLTLDPDPLVRARAADQAASPGALLDDPSSVVRLVAAHNLALHPDSAALARAARSPDAAVRWKAAAGLARTPGVAPILVELLQDPDADVRREAARALGKHDDPVATAALVAAARDANSFVRRRVAEALARHPQGRAALEELAQDSTALVAQAAARSLGRPARAYEPPRPPLDPDRARKLLASRDATLRKDTARLLAGDPAAIPLLLPLLTDPDGEVRKGAVEALGLCGASESDLAPALADPDPDTRVAALVALAEIGAAPPAAAALLGDPDAEIRLRAAEAVAAAGHDTAAFARDPDERIRAAAMARRPDLLDPGEPSVLVRRAAARAGHLLPGEADVLVLWVDAEPDRRNWADGVVAEEDDLLHLRFSWTLLGDRPPGYRLLEPPRPRPYGQPNRG